MVAIPGVTELQVPPPAASLKVVVALGQTVNVPVIVPASGEGLTVTIFVAATVPQLLLTVYDIVLVPGATPVTIPVNEPMVAIAVFTELHNPPPAASLKVVVVPGQAVNIPVMVPASGVALTVTTMVAAAIPQLLFTI